MCGRARRVNNNKIRRLKILHQSKESVCPCTHLDSSHSLFLQRTKNRTTEEDLCCGVSQEDAGNSKKNGDFRQIQNVKIVEKRSSFILFFENRIRR